MAGNTAAQYWSRLKELRKHQQFALRYISTLDKFMCAPLAPSCVPRGIRWLDVPHAYSGRPSQAARG
jgi:hypothetical protein